MLNTKLRLLIGDHETLKISKEQIRMMDSLLVACDREAQLQAQRIRLLERLDSARRAYIANQQVELNLRQEQAEDCKAQAHILQTALRQQKWRTAEVGGVGLVAIVYLSYLLIKK